MDISICRRRLATLWFSVSSVIVLLMITQTVLNHFSDAAAAWQWILSNLIPSLSLIIGVLVSENFSSRNSVIADPFLYRICMAISGFYLLILLMTLLLQPFSNALATEYLKQGQQLWIAPIQGLATAAMGAFFVRSKATQHDSPPPPQKGDAT